MQRSRARLARRSVVAGACLLVAGCLDTDGRPDDDSADDDGAGGSDADDATGGSGGDGESSSDGESGSDESTTAGLEQMGALDTTSPAFEDGERIPQEYGYDHENANPPLRIDGVPDDAESLALIVDDPDAVEPAGKVWDHWIVWNVPPERAEIPEDWEPGRAEQGTNDFGEVGYGGPRPPDREHRYRFQLFALDATLDLSSDADADALRDAMEGHVLSQTELAGTYPTD